ncbi:aldehyde dehydrogenase [Sulfitobacter mediterraneus]|uniref:aldehyde dehydrogenase n=1 Tax=Sulfitobacter mediterraneus TaxID=83219 RepID=UPI0021A645AE|nr:aldehyde dehydrogenase [Sulfitobacter mediterraneus]UWR10330.1 aldehyde dehydrogenase [Sulfitobacter mediterraneus]
MKRYEHFIDGKAVAPQSGSYFPTNEPYSGEAWAEIARGTPEDVDLAMASAETAFRAREWRDITATKRGEILRRFADLIVENADALGKIEQRDNGKLIAEVSGQVRNVAQWFYYYAGLADKTSGQVIPINKPGTFNYIKYEPLGVIVAITPWNSPLALTAWKLAPALAAGNTVVVKPSEFTSASLIELARIAIEAGLPKGVFNVVTGFGHEIGDALVRHPLARKIAFTGGEVGGRAVNVAAAEELKPVTLELGGKSPNVILADADIDQAVKGVVSGIFGASGQTCMAGSRLLLHRSIHDDVIARLIEILKGAKIGDPALMDTQIGPIATPSQLEKILSYIDIAKSEGATCAYGGYRLEGPEYGAGQFVAPTIFTDVRNDMRIAQEEVFGPVLSVMSFEDDEEALRIANDTRFGLAAAVWTQNLERSMYFADRLEAGTVWVNNYRSTSFTTTFGGYKDSGIGREGGPDAMREFQHEKSVWITPRPGRDNPFVLG